MGVCDVKFKLTDVCCKVKGKGGGGGVGWPNILNNIIAY